ncbi:unnamed protein product [Orchesella dallaii]|uniref:Uncharacterized protein n=1 Tax=Orchesella dallaii TaxID=48710 RepID=A0ABP1R7L5_9HEXA
MAQQFLHVLMMLLFIGATCDLKLVASEEEHGELVKETPSYLANYELESSFAPLENTTGNITMGSQAPNITRQHLPYNLVGKGEIQNNRSTLIATNWTMENHDVGKTNISNFQEQGFQQTQKKSEPPIAEQPVVISIFSVLAFILIVLCSMFPPDCQSWKKRRSPTEPAVSFQNENDENQDIDEVISPSKEAASEPSFFEMTPAAIRLVWGLYIPENSDSDDDDENLSETEGLFSSSNNEGDLFQIALRNYEPTSLSLFFETSAAAVTDKPPIKASENPAGNNDIISGKT